MQESSEVRPELGKGAPWRRRALWILFWTLFVLSVVPAILGWRLIATYSSLQQLHVQPVRDVSLNKAGQRGLYDGQGVVVLADGTILVADMSGSRVLAFPDGNSDSGFAFAPRQDPRELVLPCALAVGPDGTVYVLSQGTGRVNSYDPSGKLLRSAPLGSGGARGLAVDAAGNIYVGDTGVHLIRKYLPSGAPDKSYGRNPSEGGVPVAGETVGMVAAYGKLYVTAGQTISRLDSTGRVEIEQRSRGDVGILTAGPNDTLYMSDQPQNRVWVLDRDCRTIGRVVDADPARQIFIQPRGVAVPGNGFLYVVNDTRVSVYRFIQTGLDSGQVFGALHPR